MTAVEQAFEKWWKDFTKDLCLSDRSDLNKQYFYVAFLAAHATGYAEGRREKKAQLRPWLEHKRFCHYACMPGECYASKVADVCTPQRCHEKCGLDAALREAPHD